MAELPQRLREALEAAKNSLASQKDYHLLLPDRKKIWQALGSEGVKGHIRRTNLAISCAEHTLSIWQNMLPNNKEPQHILRDAENYLTGKLSESMLREKIGRFWTELDDLIYEGKHHAEVNAGFSAAVAASIAIKDVNLDDQDAEILDDELDPYDWDSSFYSSIAYSAGAPWEESSDKNKRMEFWRWYLNYAVPKAYMSA